MSQNMMDAFLDPGPYVPPKEEETSALDDLLKLSEDRSSATVQSSSRSAEEETLEQLRRSPILLDEFIRRQNGQWGHEEWLQLLEELRQAGFTPFSEAEVGALLEERRYFFALLWGTIGDELMKFRGTLRDEVKTGTSRLAQEVTGAVTTSVGELRAEVNTLKDVTLPDAITKTVDQQLWTGLDTEGAITKKVEQKVVNQIHHSIENGEMGDKFSEVEKRVNGFADTARKNLLSQSRWILALIFLVAVGIVAITYIFPAGTGSYVVDDPAVEKIAEKVTEKTIPAVNSTVQEMVNTAVEAQRQQLRAELFGELDKRFAASRPPATSAQPPTSEEEKPTGTAQRQRRRPTF